MWSKFGLTSISHNADFVIKLSKAAVTLTPVPTYVLVRVIRRKACTNINTCNSVAIKHFVKTEKQKYLKFLSKVYSTITGNVVRSCLNQNYITFLLRAVKEVTL